MQFLSLLQPYIADIRSLFLWVESKELGLAHERQIIGSRRVIGGWGQHVLRIA